MIDVRVCWRQMPFNEHRSMGEVLDAEYLWNKRKSGKMLTGGEAQRLAGLRNRDQTPQPPSNPDAA